MCQSVIRHLHKRSLTRANFCCVILCTACGTKLIVSAWSKTGCKRIACCWGKQLFFSFTLLLFSFLFLNLEEKNFVGCTRFLKMVLPLHCFPFWNWFSKNSKREVKCNDTVSFAMTTRNNTTCEKCVQSIYTWFSYFILDLCWLFDGECCLFFCHFQPTTKSSNKFIKTHSWDQSHWNMQWNQSLFAFHWGVPNE